MELKTVDIPVQASEGEFLLRLKGTSVATIIAALRAFVDQPETHDLAKAVHNEVADQANCQFKTVSASRLVMKCTRDRGHGGSCNGYPHIGCPPSIMKLPDRPDF